MSFDPDTSLTAEQKLFNVKKKLNELDRKFYDLEHHLTTPFEIVRIVHIMRVALKEIENEVDRTV
jgi:hypothetical protein